MLRGKKLHIAPIQDDLHQELKLLYARRMAIDTLIQSLVSYDRCREKSLDTDKRRTA